MAAIEDEWGPAASQSITFARIAPLRSPRSAASTGRGFPVISKTSRAPIAKACPSPASSRVCAWSRVCPCRSKVKSGAMDAVASLRSQDESNPRSCESGGTRPRSCADCEGAALGETTTGRALAFGRGAGGAWVTLGLGSATFVGRRGTSGVTVAATRRHSSASSAVSPRGGFIARRAAPAIPSAAAPVPARARSSHRQWYEPRPRRPRRCRTDWRP
jgi:hypothetical protein